MKAGGRHRVEYDRIKRRLSRLLASGRSQALSFTTPRRELSLLVAIGGRHINAYRLQEGPPRIAYFVAVAGFNQDHRPRFELLGPAIYDGLTCTLRYQQP